MLSISFRLGKTCHGKRKKCHFYKKIYKLFLVLQIKIRNKMEFKFKRLDLQLELKLRVLCFSRKSYTAAK